MAKSVPDSFTDQPPKKRAPRKLPTAELSPDDLQAIFGQNLRAARLKSGMSIVALADAAGMQFSSVSQIENGIMNVTLKTMTRLASIFNLDVSAMLQPAISESTPTKSP